MQCAVGVYMSSQVGYIMNDDIILKTRRDRDLRGVTHSWELCTLAITYQSE